LGFVYFFLLSFYNDIYQILDMFLARINSYNDFRPIRLIVDIVQLFKI